MDVFSFWISVIGTLIGAISLVFTCITLKNTKDIKKNMYKKRLIKQSVASLEIAVKDIEGRMRYINKDKCINQIDFVKEFSPVMALLEDLKILLSSKQKKQLKIIKETYNKIEGKDEEAAVEQLNFLTKLRQYCNQIITYYKENDYE